jgi:hypothetical protein
MSTVLTIAAVVVILFLLFKVFKLITRLVLIAVFLLAAFLTNPKLEKHKEAVREKPGIHLGKVTVKDLWIASLTQYTNLEGTKTIGFGLFTQVFIFRDPK